MAGSVDTRKRSREEEQNEFMPLSKRINNLHLNNNQSNLGGPIPEQLGPTVASNGQFAIGDPNSHHMHHQLHHHHGHHHPHHLLGVMNGASGSNSNSSSSGSLSLAANSGSNSPASTHASTISINGEILGDYCPVLSAEENPHYFTKNKVLYDLYIERMRRLQ
ncbi:dendritic arbor reduction protein 1 [Anopheles cruzii]|uniref:dendritic arbor reduction protein 1 n=1 Tax=Anopheles cruzii TaxID=68878 RepID=UPI0022EC7AAC|nr:dendritic arbor reduction protein 1 [Anopheles cruzii]